MKDLEKFLDEEYVKKLKLDEEYLKNLKKSLSEENLNDLEKVLYKEEYEEFVKKLKMDNKYWKEDLEILKAFLDETYLKNFKEKLYERGLKAFKNLYKIKKESFEGYKELMRYHEDKAKEQERIDQIKKLKEKTPRPQKKHLSKENQKKVVEGCLYMVFDATREWYNFFEGKLSLERIYYLCLEALMNSVKYMVHNEKPVFKFYVSKSIERNIVKYVAKYMHATYREIYEIIHYRCKGTVCDRSKEFVKKLEEYFCSLPKEELEKTSKIYDRLKNEYCDIDYIKNISSNEFMLDYKNALENLDEVAKIVMQLSFDNNGYRGLTNAEIANYLGIDSNISTIRSRAIRILRKDAKLNTYLN